MLKNAIIAGTFDSLHAGHKELLKAGLLRAKKITIGITTNSFASARKQRTINSFEERKGAVAKFLGKSLSRASIYPLESEFGNSTFSSQYDAIVVSAETKHKAEEINEIRQKNKLLPLKLILVQTLYSEDYKKISSTRVAEGEITPEGKRKKKIVFSLGTENSEKMGGAKKSLSKFFKNFALLRTEPKSNVSGQPFEEQTLNGAINRANFAYASTRCDFGMGLESGLFEFLGKHYNIMWCALFDGEELFMGCSMGFAVPDEIIKEARTKTLKEAFRPLFGKRANSAITELSKGRVTRKDMAEQACSCALVRLANRPLFEGQGLNKGQLESW
jgi:inosine/xanthosine triphosphatase